MTKNISHSNYTDSVQVVGYASDGADVLTSFGEGLIATTSYKLPEEHRNAIRDASHWIEDQDGANGLGYQAVRVIQPGQTITETVYL